MDPIWSRTLLYVFTNLVATLNCIWYEGRYYLCGDSTKFQKIDVESNVQLTPTSVIKKSKRSYSMTTRKQQRIKIQRIL